MIRLHHCYQTRSDRTLWLLTDLGVDFDLHVYPFDATLREEPYRSINPIGRVPALEIDGHVMIESGAMAEVLAERFADRGMTRATDHAERMDYLMFIHFAETLSVHCANLTQQHIVLYEDSMRSPLLMKLEAKRLERCIASLEPRLGRHGFLLSSGISAADFGVAQAALMAQRFVRLDAYIHVRAWLDRMTALPSYAALTPPEGTKLLYAKPFYNWEDYQ